MMSIIAFPEAKLVAANSKQDTLNITRVWSIGTIKVEEALDSLYSAATKAGANAIVDFSINEISQRYNEGTTEPLTLFGYKISGFAIKRLGAFRNDSGGGTNSPGAENQ
jgi:hypothetical protein